MPSPAQVYWTFATPTARNAQVVLPVEVGCWCMVISTGLLHQAIAGGSGASCWSQASDASIAASDVTNDSSRTGSTVAAVLNTMNKNNTSASAPGATDDADDGYSVCSLWVKSSGEIYICVDATVGAAVWTELDPKD